MGLQAPPGVFQVGRAVCWKCGRGIDVFTWRGHSMWARTCPLEGRPKTVKLVYSATAGGMYYANHCDGCGRIQGDWFLYHEPDGPFFGGRRKGA
jgi:hypothetical protein